MENFNLTDDEQKKFGEHFATLDTDKQAKLSFKNVRHFLSAYQLGEDDLEKIFNICGAKRLGHFNRSQFYIALKLVSLAQNSYELTLENLGRANLPLPRRLSCPQSLFNDVRPKHKCDLPLNGIDSFAPSTHSPAAGIILPPPPSSASKSKFSRLKNKRSPSQICKFCNKQLIEQSLLTNADQEQTDNLRSFVLICSNCKHSNQSGLDSPTCELHTAASDRLNSQTSNAKNLSDLNSSSDNSRCSSTELYETIDNSLAFERLKTWEKIESNQTRDGVDSADESKHCLLNDDEEPVDPANRIDLIKNGPSLEDYEQLAAGKYDSPFGYDCTGHQLDSKFESANYDSSNFARIARIEEENDEDVWSMNDEQIKFYYEKFCRLLSAPSDHLLAGSSVKSFFEKSRLRLADLKKIWSLADLDGDGNLTLIEFCIAMHLVVLKRNEVPLPDELPQSLSPVQIKRLLAANKLQLTSLSPMERLATENSHPNNYQDSNSYRDSNRDSSYKETSRGHAKEYSSITDSSGSLPSYHHVSINVSSDNLSSNVSSNAAVCSLQPAARNSFDYYLPSVDHHASQSDTCNPLNPLLPLNASAHLRNHQPDIHTAATTLGQHTAGNLSSSISGNLSGSLSSASIGEHDAASSLLYSPNREWTKFGSPFTTSRLQQANAATGNQQNAQQNHQIQPNQIANPLANDANCLMAPANFDKIELDPRMPHPMPVKLASSAGNQAASSTLVNKDRVTSLNPPAYPARPRAGGHARSSSLDLTRNMINFNSANIAQHQGAFVNYRKHLQQQQSGRHPLPFDTGKPTGHPPTGADKQYYLQVLRTKYALPKQTASSTELVSSLKERNFLVECVYDQVIDDFASTLEQLSKLSERS